MPATLTPNTIGPRKTSSPLADAEYQIGQREDAREVPPTEEKGESQTEQGATGFSMEMMCQLINIRGKLW